MSHSHEFEPSDFYEFIHLHCFDEAFQKSHLADDDLTALQMLIMANPKGSPVIRGTGGIRKTRFAPLHEHRGKSGAYRVCYAVFEEVRVIVLILIYSKSEKDDLSNEEKNELKDLYNRIKTAYSQ